MKSLLYQVELDLYHGPLDLLLYLVRRHEVDILDLPISTITSQFMEYLNVLEIIDLEEIGNFVVFASLLMEIKSKQVLPQPEMAAEPELEEEPQSQLIQQLLEYKKYKEAALSLQKQAALWQEQYPRLHNDRPQEGKDPSSDRIKDVELWDLVSALNRILRRESVEGQRQILYDETPLSFYVEQISERVRREKRTSFSSLFENTTQRSKIISIFLAILELLRHHHFQAEQPIDYQEIWIMPPPETLEKD